MEWSGARPRALLAWAGTPAQAGGFRPGRHRVTHTRPCRAPPGVETRTARHVTLTGRHFSGEFVLGHFGLSGPRWAGRPAQGRLPARALTGSPSQNPPWKTVLRTSRPNRSSYKSESPDVRRRTPQHLPVRIWLGYTERFARCALFKFMSCFFPNRSRLQRTHVCVVLHSSQLHFGHFEGFRPRG